MILTRELVNKNVRYHDWVIKYNYLQIQDYDFNYLSSLVDAYKNLFLSKNARSGQRVIIAARIGIQQIALVLACAELGLIIMVVGDPFASSYEENRNLNIKHYGKADFFVVKNKTCTKKFEIFKGISGNTIVIEDETLDFTINNNVLANDNSVLLELLDGTKTVEHTHEFIALIFKRNAELFYGNIGSLLDGLNHGISPSIHFFPGLLADTVTDYYSFYVVENSLMFLSKQLEKHNTTLQHLFVPHTSLMMGSMGVSLPECTIYTTGDVKTEWINRVTNKTVKNIVSILGNVEVYGPLLINSVTSQNFHENAYTELDDFYSIHITENHELSVRTPVYQNNFLINNHLYSYHANKYILEYRTKD